MATEVLYPPAPTPDQGGPTPPQSPKRRTLRWVLVGLAASVVTLAALVAIVLLTTGEQTPVAPPHTAEVGEPALVPVNGYVYVDTADPELLAMTRATVESTNEQVRAQAPDQGDFYSGWSVHDVQTTDGEYVCSMALSEVNAEFFDQGLMTREGMLVNMAGLMAAGGASVGPEIIAGQTVFVAAAPDDTVGYAWLHEDTFVMVSSGQPGGQTAVRAFVDALISTMGAPPEGSANEADSEWTYLDDLRKGDCFSWEDVNATEVERVALVPCKTKHDAEVYAIVDLPTEPRTYPGDQEVLDLATDACYDAFASYVGISWENSRYDFISLSPTQAGWNKYEDRRVTCVAGDMSGRTLTKSIKGAAR